MLPTKRNDDQAAGRWRGPLFDDWHHRTLRPPRSVTFPICVACHYVIWDWPHFAEPVPDNAICDDCSE
jgi:hypothetical protein